MVSDDQRTADMAAGFEERKVHTTFDLDRLTEGFYDTALNEATRV